MASDSLADSSATAHCLDPHQGEGISDGTAPEHQHEVLASALLQWARDSLPLVDRAIAYGGVGVALICDCRALVGGGRGRGGSASPSWKINPVRAARRAGTAR